MLAKNIAAEPSYDRNARSGWSGLEAVAQVVVVNIDWEGVECFQETHGGAKLISGDLTCVPAALTSLAGLAPVRKMTCLPVL
jgi:hypothetical protein